MDTEISAEELMYTLGRELDSQDNRATNQPMFVVYTKGYRDKPEFVTVFLTADAADAFISENIHNLRDPWVFVDSGYKNHQWCILRRVALDTYHRRKPQDNGA